MLSSPPPLAWISNYHCQEFPLITLSYLSSSLSTKYMGTAGGRVAVTAGKETHRYLLRAADPWDNGFSAVFNIWGLKSVGSAVYCRAF